MKTYRDSPVTGPRHWGVSFTLRHVFARRMKWSTLWVCGPQCRCLHGGEEQIPAHLGVPNPVRSEWFQRSVWARICKVENYMKSSVFWYITPCNPLKGNRRFRRTCLHLQSRRINRVRNQHGSRHQADHFDGLHSIVSQKIEILHIGRVK
jgi:hypothetical protein